MKLRTCCAIKPSLKKQVGKYQFSEFHIQHIEVNNYPRFNLLACLAVKTVETGLQKLVNCLRSRGCAQEYASKGPMRRGETLPSHTSVVIPTSLLSSLFRFFYAVREHGWSGSGVWAWGDRIPSRDSVWLKENGTDCSEGVQEIFVTNNQSKILD